MKALFTRMILATALVGSMAVCSGQTSNTVSAKYVAAPGSGSNFSIALVNSGPATEVAGFAFKVQYDPAQVSIVGVKNNTGDSAASIQYDLGAEKASGNPAVPAERVISATTMQNLANATNLVEIQFSKKPGFAPPLKLQVTDRLSAPVVDGLQGGDLKNIPHVFDISGVTQ